MLQQRRCDRAGGRARRMTEKMGLIGPEVSDRTALDMPLDRAEILVTNKRDAEALRARNGALCRGRPVQVIGSSAAACRSRSAPTPAAAHGRRDGRRAEERGHPVGACFGRVVAAEHRDRPADVLARDDPGLPDRRRSVSGFRRDCRPGQCGRAAGFGRDRFLLGRRGYGSSATRRTRRATSWRISAWWSSSRSSGSTPATRCWRS